LRCQPIFQGFQLRQDTSGGRKHLFAFWCQPNTAAVPDEHRQVEVALQLLDFSTHCALGQTELLRRLREAARACDLDQRLQGLERRNVVNFIHALFEWLDEFITLVVSLQAL